MVKFTVVEFLKAFRFRVSVNGRELSMAACSAIEEYVERHGNRRVRPVVFEAAPRKPGEPVGTKTQSLADLRRLRGGRVRLDEFDNEGQEVARSIILEGCRFRHYTCAPHDAREDALIIEKVTVHPRKLRIITPRGTPA